MYLKKELYGLIKTDESIFDFIQESALDGLWYWDLENPENEWMNTRFWTVLGYNPDEMPHKSAAWQGIINQEDLKLASDNLTKHCEYPNHPYDQVVRYTHKNGSTVWIRCRGKAIRDKDGKPIRMLGAHQDVTELKSREQELYKANEINQESEEKYRAMYNNAPLSYQSLDENGCFIDINPMWIKTLGYEKDEVIGKWYGDFLHPDYVEHFRKNFSAFKKRGYVSEVQFKLKRKDNTYIYVSLEGCVGYTPEGKFKQTYCVFKDITEQKALENAIIKAKEKAEESEKKYRLITEFAADVVWVLNLTTGKFVYISPSIFQLRGFTVEEAMNETLEDAVTPESLKIVKDAVTKNAKYFIEHPEANNYYFYEIQQPCKNGQIIWVEFSTKFRYSPTGNRELVGVSRNIDERKRAELRLGESEMRFRSTFDKSPVGSVIVGLDKCFIKCNEAFCNFLGYTNDELFGKTIADITYSEDKDLGMSDLKLLMEGKIESSAYIQKRYLHKDGFILWGEVSISLVRDGNNEPLYFLPVIADITERKQAEEKLKLLNRAIEASSVAVEITDAEGNINYINPFFTELTGYSYQEVLGKNPRFLKSGNHPKTFYEELWNTILSGREWTGEFQNKKKNGELYWEKAVISSILNSKGAITHFVAIKNDISEKKKAEREIIELNQELEKRVELRTAQLTEVNKELEAFTYSVSHDLRGPLRAINGFAQILVEDYADLLPEEAKSTCIVIRNNAIKMGKLINDLLKLSRLSIQEMLFTNIDMNVLTDTVFDEVATVEQKNRILFNRGNLENCFGDGTLIKQVLVNLISNAVKYTGKEEKPVIEINSSINGKYINYSIKDNGAGFDMKYADRLFNVFQRLHTEKEFDGTGVGLAIVHRIINRHEGKVWANGTEGKGAEFYFSLPTCQ